MKVKETPIKEIRSLMIADLHRSKLLPLDIRKLKLEPVPTKYVHDKTGRSSGGGYVLPYFDIDGKLTKFYRIKYLGTVKKLTNEKRTPKYWQPLGTIPQAYFPPYLKWSKIVADEKMPIYLTEGEKKAAIMCKNGYNCIGLGGIWSWKSKRYFYELLPSLTKIKWKGRKVYLVYDSDIASNSDVSAAAMALADKLAQQGAEVKLLRLPEDDEEVKGVDDFFKKYSKTKFNQIEPTDLVGQEELERLNDEVAIIQDVERVYVRERNRLYTPRTLMEGSFADRTSVILVDGKPREVNALQAWMKWPKHQEYRSLIYEPDIAKVNCADLNMWPGWGCTPKKGPVTLWKELLDFAFDGEPDARNWFERWVAYPIQYPGVKLYTAAVFFSLAHGVGKSLIGEHIKRVYGDNGYTISYRDLRSNFNWWAHNRQFVLGEEITGSDKRRDADHVKGLITSESITINVKMQPNYSIKDTINYLFTTNHPNAFYLENTDRRFFIHEIKGDPMPHKFYKAYNKWYRSDIGVSALMFYLRTLKLGTFHPLEPALVTEAKEEMRYHSQSGLDDFATGIMAGDVPELDGKTIPHAVLTIEELCALYDPDARPGAINKAMGNALARARVPKQQVRIPGKGMKRVVAVKNPEHWATVHKSEWIPEYLRTHIVRKEKC